jgi:hypothetical protein
MVRLQSSQQHEQKKTKKDLFFAFCEPTVTREIFFVCFFFSIIISSNLNRFLILSVNEFAQREEPLKIFFNAWDVAEDDDDDDSSSRAFEFRPASSYQLPKPKKSQSSTNRYRTGSDTIAGSQADQ